MILVDTSVIADIFTEDPDWFEWSSSKLRLYANAGLIAYNAIIFAELSVKFSRREDLERRLSAYAYLPLSLDVAFQSGKAFEKYRNSGGRKSRPLPDFYIGAHAYVDRLPLLTRDPRRVRTYF